MTAKIYRVETMASFQSGASNSNLPSVDLDNGLGQQILAELAELKEKISPLETASSGILAPSESIGELEDALRIKRELDGIYEAIAETKREIASLHQMNLGQQKIQVKPELDAIVVGTEKATDAILESAEAIEQQARALTASLEGSQAEMVEDISDKVVHIFEACNFQDLTGQRIQKVVNVLKFIEERTESMMEIWGGADIFKNIEGSTPEEEEGDRALLNGPALESTEDVASQDDIDALFD